MTTANLFNGNSYGVGHRDYNVIPHHKFARKTLTNVYISIEQILHNMKRTEYLHINIKDG